MTATALERLFTPLRIRDVEIPNRTVASGLGWLWAGLDGEATLPTEALAHFWGARGAGGLGLIVSEPQSVHPTSTASPRVIENSSDAIVEPYRRVTEAVHAQGTKIVAQLNHAGHLGGTGFRSLPLWAPSPVRAPMGARFPAGGGVIPHAMAAAEIQELVAAFAAAAARAVAAGFDGIELNAAEGYLIAQFLSPVSNRRGDGYGGSVEARRRFLLEVVEAVRAAIGPAPLLGVRIGTDTYIEGAFTVEDIGPLAAALATSRGVDYLATAPLNPPGLGSEPGAFADLAKAARESSGLPVIYHGWVDGPSTAEELLASGVCDLVGMSRATLADPELPRKAREGRLSEIRPCLACNQTCLAVGSVCVLNPAGAVDPTAEGSNGRSANGAGATGQAKQVLVVGGGIAGMETALQLVGHGHAVTVWEREGRLGGQLRVAARAPHRARFDALADYYERELTRCGVGVELGREATRETVAAAGADAVVIATGGFGRRPQVPGIDQPHVTDVRSVLRGFVEPGEHTLVILGDAEHQHQGLTVAEYVASLGRSVHVVSDAHFAGDLLELTTRLDAYRRLMRSGVTFTPMVELVAIREHNVHMRNRYSLEPLTFEADTVVLAFGDDADSALLAELDGSTAPIFAAGDVVAPRDLLGAARDALLVALQL